MGAGAAGDVVAQIVGVGEGAVMAKLTRAELIRVNRQLKAQGERICSSCYQKRALTTEYFYRTERQYRGGVRVDWSGACRACTLIERSEKQRRRYREDEAWREYTLERTKRWQRENRDKANAATRRYHRNRKVRILTAAMKGAA